MTVGFDMNERVEQENGTKEKLLEKILVSPISGKRLARGKDRWQAGSAEKYPIRGGKVFFSNEPAGSKYDEGSRLVSNSAGVETKLAGLLGFCSNREQIIHKYCEGKQRILNYGSGNARIADSVNLDVFGYPNVDVVSSHSRLPFRDKSFDVVVLDSVLEHVPDPQEKLDEAYRVLRKGGRVIVIVPFLQRYHGYPHDYQRYTITGLKNIARRFRQVECGVSGGSRTALLEFAFAYVKNAAPNRLVFILLLIVLAVPILLLNFAGTLIPRKKEFCLANSNFFVGEKA